MIYRLYEHILQSRIAKSNLPGCVAIILSSGDLFDDGLVRLCELLEWSRSIGLAFLVIYVNDDAPMLLRKIAYLLAAVPAQISLHTREGVEQTGKGGPLKVVISLGYGGKREVTEAFRALLRDVETGHLHPEQIDEKTIESHLRFPQKLDLVISAGGARLSDFMIWQAAYSELYFTDVNWQELRTVSYTHLTLPTNREV